jgi:hypothetical protein
MTVGDPPNHALSSPSPTYSAARREPSSWITHTGWPLWNGPSMTSFTAALSSEGRGRSCQLQLGPGAGQRSRPGGAAAIPAARLRGQPPGPPADARAARRRVVAAGERHATLGEYATRRNPGSPCSTTRRSLRSTSPPHAVVRQGSHREIAAGPIRPLEHDAGEGRTSEVRGSTPSGRCDGASETRTRDLLGAIQE